MFFALKGERFDGNAYAAKAIESGCAVAVVDDATVAAALGDRAILVDDVLTTLQELAAEHRRHFRGPVLQITGTNGKTTTKELVAAVIAKRYNVLYTQGNLNNHIGVPLTLLRLRPEHDFAIIETGANHLGEIAALTKIVAPDFGLVTNVGRAHLAGFGSFDGVKRTKGELYDYLAAKVGAKVFVNGADAELMGMIEERFDSEKRGEKVVEYVRGGLQAGSGAQVAFWWEEGGRLGGETAEHSVGTEHTVRTRLVGAYNVNNLLAAATVGSYFGVKAADIDDALAKYTPSLGRSELKHTANNELIVDAYNANPTSMQVALENFAAMRHPHKMVILGDMRELGEDSAAEHRRVVEAVMTSDVERAWFVGTEFAKAVAEAGQSSEKAEVTCLPDVTAAKAKIRDEGPKGALILIKGSNGTRLFELPEML